VIIVALLYRRLLGDLITGGVTRLRAGPFELAWDQAKSGVERTRASTGQAEALSSPMPPNGAEPFTSLLGTELVDLANTDPREAVLRAYGAVRNAFLKGLSEAGVEVDSSQELDALGLMPSLA
jgi:hypothetical protein